MPPGTRYYVFEQEMLYDDTDVSFMVNNAWFQLVICFRQKNSERNVEFLIHTSRELEKDLDANNPVPRYLFSDMVLDEGFVGVDMNHVLDMFPATSLTINFDRVLKLNEAAALRLLVFLYKRSEVAVDMISSWEISAIHTFAFYEELSKFVHANQLRLARYYFKGDLSAVNCILFTCIALSDPRFFERYSNCVNGGVPGIMLYFYSLFLFMTNLNTKRIISRSSHMLHVEHYGSFLPPLLGNVYNNALDLKQEKIQKTYRHRYVLEFALMSPVVSVGYFCSESFH